jgi:CheY-like chemotaxis protein
MLRILYLDNSALDMDLMREALSQQHVSFEMVEATNKDEFRAALDAGHFDIVFSDSGVESFDGQEALALVRELAPHTFFIFITGHSDGPVFEVLKRSGADDVFSKRHLHWLGGAIGRAIRARRKPPATD